MNDAKPTRLSETTPDPWLGKEINGYRIDSVIGRGGMGVVYKAIQLSLSRPVAIKVIPESFAEHPQFVERFHREVDVLSKLSHPNVVTVFERGEVEGRLYVVMEYVEGTSLRDVIKAGPLPKTEALSIVRSVLQALEHAHARGVVHRDIKPENVLVAPGGIVKVADFGLSRLLGPQDVTRLTHTHLLLGTFEYMAPEQREKAKEADERSDLYATGVVLYEMLAGELPIGNFDPLSEKRPKECDARIDEIVSKSLQKTPEKRYQAAAEMGDAVSRLLSSAFAPKGEPAPLPPRRSPPRFAGRSSAPAIIVAVMLLFGLFGAMIFAYLLVDSPPAPEQSHSISPFLEASTRGVELRTIGHLPVGASDDEVATAAPWVESVAGGRAKLLFDETSRKLALEFPLEHGRSRIAMITAAYELVLESWYRLETKRLNRLRRLDLWDEFESRVSKNPPPPRPEKTR